MRKGDIQQRIVDLETKIWHLERRISSSPSSPVPWWLFVSTKGLEIAIKYSNITWPYALMNSSQKSKRPRLALFQQEEDDSDNATQPVKTTTTPSLANTITSKQIDEALAENAEVYDYDAAYDQIKAAENNRKTRLDTDRKVFLFPVDWLHLRAATVHWRLVEICRD